MLVPTQAVRPTAMAQGLTAKPTKPEAEDCPLLPHQIQVLQAPHPRRRTPNHDFQFSFFFPTTFIFFGTSIPCVLSKMFITIYVFDSLFF